MELYDWNQLPGEPMNPLITRRMIHTAHMTIARIDLKKGAVVPEHSHVNEQVCTVGRGALQFTLEGRDQVILPSQSLVIPPNVPHSVVALEDSVATDIFSPVRQDWIDGDDAYLRK
jgi:quercetin dioxygenase-like cupin family protein